MTSPTPPRRIRTCFAALALTVGLASGCTAGDWRYDSPPAAGVQADAGTVKARNILIVADDSGEGVLHGALYSSEAVSLTAVSVQAEAADGSRGEPVAVDVTGDVPRKGTLNFEDTEVLISGADLLPGRLAYVGLRFSDGTELVLDAPVMSADHPDFDGVEGN